MYLITWSVSFETWAFAIWAQIAIAHVSNKTSSRDEKQTLGEYYFLHPDNKKVPLIWQKISGHTSSQASQRFVYEVVVSYIFGKMRTSKVQQQLILVQWRNWRRRLYQHHDNQRKSKTLTHFWSLTRSKIADLLSEVSSLLLLLVWLTTLVRLYTVIVIFLCRCFYQIWKVNI